jgi:AcrR family transcriptional regulator
MTGQPETGQPETGQPETGQPETGQPETGHAPAGRPRARRRGGRSGRRGGDSGTREAILAAARTRFGDFGYDGATIRGIAADAGVDAALVHHFFGNKERLFAAAMRLPIVPGELVASALAAAAADPSRSLGEQMLRTVLAAWDVAEMRATFLGLLRSAVTSEQAAAMLREFATEAILGRIAGAAGGLAGDAGRRPAGPAQPGGHTPPGRGAEPSADPRFRAALVASQVLGLALTRYVLELEPLAAASTDDLAAAIGPTIDRYLTGGIR